MILKSNKFYERNIFFTIPYSFLFMRSDQRILLRTFNAPAGTSQLLHEYRKKQEFLIFILPSHLLIFQRKNISRH